MFLAIALPVSAAQEHHPAAGDVAAPKTEQVTTAPTTQADTGKIDAAMLQMRETRMKMQAATDPAEKKSLMHMHMQQMHEGMKMMDKMGMMGGQNADKMSMGAQGMNHKPMTDEETTMKPKEGHDMSKMDANSSMEMKEGKMAMMEKMMGTGGMMGGMQIMEKKMSMMMEMMNGMMAQQQEMMKK